MPQALTPEQTQLSESLHLYILSQLPAQPLAVIDGLRKTAGSFAEIFRLSSRQLKELGLGAELAGKLRRLKQKYSVEKLAADLRETGVAALCYLDPLYPALLKQIHDPPKVLFFRGSWDSAKEACVAIVGSRSMSSYGQTVLSKITGPLLNAGVTIVSGLAIGIDSASHKEAVKRTQRTIAVLGSGVDEASVYPQQHTLLSEQILEHNGLLVSEYPPGTPGLKHHFIARNRIIAGLSLGVVIVECRQKSGALLTADFAADYNRSLFAVPGPIYSSLSAGPHSLIKNGASLIASGEDILQELDLKLEQSVAARTRKNSFTEIERRVVECIRNHPATVDGISKTTTLPATEISQTLTMLELRGIIKNTGPEGFIKL
jgi:DNA processing protein